MKLYHNAVVVWSVFLCVSITLAVETKLAFASRSVATDLEKGIYVAFHFTFINLQNFQMGTRKNLILEQGLFYNSNTVGEIVSHPRTFPRFLWVPLLYFFRTNNEAGYSHGR